MAWLRSRHLGPLAIEIAIGGLEFGLETDLELGEVDEFPAREGPVAIVPIVRDAEQEVVGIVIHLGGVRARSIVEGAKGGLAAALFEELGIEVGDFTRCDVFDPEIRVAGPLLVAIGSLRNRAEEIGVSVDSFPQGVFKKAGGLIDAAQSANGGDRLVVDGQGLVRCGADAFI